MLTCLCNTMWQLKFLLRVTRIQFNQTISAAFCRSFSGYSSRAGDRRIISLSLAVGSVWKLMFNYKIPKRKNVLLHLSQNYDVTHYFCGISCGIANRGSNLAISPLGFYLFIFVRPMCIEEYRYVEYYYQLFNILLMTLFMRNVLCIRK